MQLLTLGGVGLTENPFRRPKLLLLLAYLSLHGPSPRHDVVRLFYQDSKDPADALATALARLRDVGELIEVRDGRLVSRVSCDALVFQDHLDAGRLAEALTLYQGPFLDGLAREISGELEEWVIEMREQLASRARDAHLSLGRQALFSEN